MSAACGCESGHRRCQQGDALWDAANAVYRSSGYEAWLKALEPYNRHQFIVAVQERGVTLTWHQIAEFPFDDADFYEPGRIVTVGCDGFRVNVERDGESDLDVGEHRYRKPAEFRAAFPDGVTPEDADGLVEWNHNGWFDLYRTSDGAHLENEGGVAHSLMEALDHAAEVVVRVARDARIIREVNSGDPDQWITDVPL